MERIATFYSKSMSRNEKMLDFIFHGNDMISVLKEQNLCLLICILHCYVEYIIHWIDFDCLMLRYHWH